MRVHYSFSIPQGEYCNDKAGLLTFLHQKIRAGHQCIYCDAGFETEEACRKHMLDKNHTRIGTEGRSRTGAYSEEATKELQAQLAPFYDYAASFRDLNNISENDREAGNCKRQK